MGQSAASPCAIPETDGAPSIGEASVRVLIVDDDAELRRVLTLALTDEEYDVRSVPDGQAALEVLESWAPQVILLDLMMPRMDGWTFRTQQLATQRVAQIPVIVLSAARDVRFEGLQPTVVMPKPFNLDRLLNTVAELVR
jgi:DNA-binding response OmpR family regulator